MCMRADIQLHTQRRLLWSAASCEDHGWCPTVAISIPIGSLYIQSLLCPCANRVPRLAVTAMLRHTARPLRFPRAHTLPARTATPMFRPLELFIGLRYTRAKRRNHFISFIALTSMLGIALGVMALITDSTVISGFQKELRDRILGVVAHATVSGAGGGVLHDWQPLAQRLERVPDVVGVAPYVDGEGMLSSGQSVSGALIRGVSPRHERTVSNVGEKMVAGSLDDLVPGQYGIVLGKELALRLGEWRGDKITLIAPQATVTPAGILPRRKRFTFVGIFEIGMYEYDSALALLDLDDAAKLYRLVGVCGVCLLFVVLLCVS